MFNSVARYALVIVTAGLPVHDGPKTSLPKLCAQHAQKDVQTHRHPEPKPYIGPCAKRRGVCHRVPMQCAGSVPEWRRLLEMPARSVQDGAAHVHVACTCHARAMHVSCMCHDAMHVP